jgi:adenylate cyclase
MADGPQAATQHGFLAELKRRRVIRVLVLYAVVGWIVIEVASVVFPALHLPSWTITLVIVLVALGLPIALTLAWAVDIGPHGLQRTPPLVAAAPPVPAATVEPVPQPVGAPPRESQRAAEMRHTIAVLPFVNMSGDAENEYFSDGISEEILNLLTKLPQLKVSSRTSSFVFKGKEASIPMVARELGVGNVLEGSVRRAGEHVRITAQLIETDTDSHLWSETYDREMKDVFAIQDDIARSIVDALQIALSPKERRALQNAATANAGAYDFYLKGRKYLYAFTRRDFRSAISMFERAIELDPRYALAYAGMADAYSMLYRYAEATPRNMELAEQASQRAIELDPDSAEAQTSLGMALFTTGQFAAAAKQFETAILINPNLFEIYLFYGRACLAQGEFEKAARLFIRAGEVNPTDYQGPIYLAMVYRSMGRTELAQQADADALEIIERHNKVTPDDARALCFGAGVLALRGQRDRAIEWVEAALQSRENEPQFLYNAACTFAQLGEDGRALDLLERAVDLGYGDRVWIEHDSDFASLHGTPRFDMLLQRMPGAPV